MDSYIASISYGLPTLICGLTGIESSMSKHFFDWVAPCFAVALGGVARTGGAALQAGAAEHASCSCQWTWP